MDEVVVIGREELKRLIREALRESQAANAEVSEYFRNTKEIANFLGVSPRSIPSMVARDGLPATVVQGKYRARREDIQRWYDERLAAGRVPSTNRRRERNRRR